MNAQEIYVCLIIFLGAFTQGMTGFGFALVTVPLLSLFMDIKHAVALGALCGLIINGLLFLKYKKEIRFSEIKALMVGGVLGIPIGAYMLNVFSSRTLEILLAVILLIYPLLNMFKVFKSKQLNKSWGYLFGLFSGILGGALNTNGPPVLIYSLLQNWGKVRFKASLVGYFTMTSVLIVSSHFVSRITGIEVLEQILWLLPLIILGLIGGIKIFNRIDTYFYNKIVLFSLILLAIILIVK